jgi:hypothetical protein
MELGFSRTVGHLMKLIDHLSQLSWLKLGFLSHESEEMIKKHEIRII